MNQTQLEKLQAIADQIAELLPGITPIQAELQDVRKKKTNHYNKDLLGTLGAKQAESEIDALDDEISRLKEIKKVLMEAANVAKRYYNHKNQNKQL